MVLMGVHTLIYVVHQNTYEFVSKNSGAFAQSLHKVLVLRIFSLSIPHTHKYTGTL